MSIYFVSRHPGARDWAARHGVAVDRIIEHLDQVNAHAGDTVVGTLPVNLAAEICARGARYLHLSLDLPFDKRGLELTSQDMMRFGARLEQYQVVRISC